MGDISNNTGSRKASSYRHLVAKDVLPLEFAPLLNRIISPPLKPVNRQIIKPEEKLLVSRVVDIMVALDLRFVQEKQDDGVLVYRLDPPIDVFITYDEKRAPDIAVSRYATRQLIASEIDAKVIERHAESFDETSKPKIASFFNRTSLPDDPDLSPKKGGHEEEMASSPPSASRKLEDEEGNVDIADKPPVDFFGRLITPKQTTSKGTALEGTQSSFKATYKFYEGMSAAVRKPLLAIAHFETESCVSLILGGSQSWSCPTPTVMSRYERNFQGNDKMYDRKPGHFGDSKRNFKHHRNQETKERGHEYLIQLTGSGRHAIGIPRDVPRQCSKCEGLRDSNGHFQLILGVKSNGATEFLIPSLNISGIQRRHDLQPYYVWGASFPFEALSPITIANESRLEELVILHMPGKKGKSSKANKGYYLGGNRLTSVTHPRAYYEQVRLLMATMTETTWFMSHSYGLAPSEDRPSRFLLITCNSYKLGTEAGFRDAAWGTADLSSLRTVTEVEMLRPILEQDLDFQNDIVDRRRRLNHETLLINDMDDERIGLKRYLREQYANTSGGPLIVLVHDWNTVKALLAELGIETGSWKNDLSELIRGKQAVKDKQEEPSRKRRDSRSRSPARRDVNNEPSVVKRENREFSNHETRSGEHRNNHIYVIGTKTLYTTVRKVGNLKDSLVAASIDFDIAEADGMSVDTICAGNELPLLWILFTKMATGPWCDEMWRTQFKGKQAGYSSDEDQEEETPQPSASGPPKLSDPSVKVKEKDPFGFDSDDDEY
ncbi:hypothetical protein FRC17_005347 [Serendipita sp. 399]|nr:hypothetical protein FRC17_005347 [Serendipita sp. 399]